MFRSGPYSRCIASNNDDRLLLSTNNPKCFVRCQNASKNICQHVFSTDVDDPFSETYVSRTLYLCKLPYDMTEDSVRELCEPFGDLKKVVVYPRKGIAFVEYFDIRKAEGARNTLKSSLVQGRIIDAQYSRGRESRFSRDNNTGTLYIKPIINDKTTIDPNTEDDYKELFCTYGEVKKVSSNRKRELEKFVEFYDIRGAEASQKALNGYDFNGVILEIQFANSQSRTLNSDSRTVANSHNSTTSSQSLRVLSEGNQRLKSSFKAKKKNRLMKFTASQMFGKLDMKDLSHCELYSESSKDLEHNRQHAHPDLSLLYQLPTHIQETSNFGEFNKFPPLTQHSSDDPTRTGNIANSLKTLLSTFKYQ